MKLKKFFRNSDRNCQNELPGVYLMYQLLQHVPNNWTDIDGNTVTMDYLTAANWKYLEREYFHNYSKDKESSVLLDEIYEDEEFHEDDVNYVAEMVNLANDIWTRFGEGWCRAWYALSTKYRPLDNYDGQEKTTYNNVERESTTDNWRTDKLDGTGSSNNVYGFNSNSAVPQSTASTDPKNTLQGRFTQPSGVHEINEGSVHSKDKQTGSIDNERHGNLGVTTSQQMLASELDFRANYNFYKLMFDNIDDVLTCHCYGGGY